MCQWDDCCNCHKPVTDLSSSDQMVLDALRTHLHVELDTIHGTYGDRDEVVLRVRYANHIVSETEVTQAIKDAVSS